MYPKSITHSSDFSSGIPAFIGWTNNVSVSGGRLVCTAPYQDFAGFDTGYSDISESEYSIQLISYSYHISVGGMSNIYVRNGEEGAGFDISVTDETNPTSAYISAWANDEDYNVPSFTVWNGYIEIPFGAYIRVRESGGTLYWEYSTDGRNWSLLASCVTVDVFKNGGTQVYLETDLNNWSSSTTQTVLFDNLNNLPPISPPTVSTGSASNVSTTTASVNGNNVSDDGGATVTQRGIVYSTTSNPTTANTKVVASGTTGAFNANLAGLTMATTYYVRAYAINSKGTSYGNQISFTTLSSVTVNNDRSARLSGKATTSDTRSATTRGGLAVSNTRSATTRGQASLNNTITATVAGKDTEGDERSGAIHGSDTSSHELGATIQGGLITSGEASSFLAGGSGRHVETFITITNRGAGTTADWTGDGKLGMK